MRAMAVALVGLLLAGCASHPAATPTPTPPADPVDLTGRPLFNVTLVPQMASLPPAATVVVPAGIQAVNLTILPVATDPCYTQLPMRADGPHGNGPIMQDVLVTFPNGTARAGFDAANGCTGVTLHQMVPVTTRIVGAPGTWTLQVREWGSGVQLRIVALPG